MHPEELEARSQTDIVPSFTGVHESEKWRHPRDHQRMTNKHNVLHPYPGAGLGFKTRAILALLQEDKPEVITLREKSQYVFC